MSQRKHLLPRDATNLYSGTRRTWIRLAGCRAWILALVAASAFLFFAYPPLSVGALETPGVEVGDGTVRVGDDVLAGDGCARAGGVVVGNCGEDSGGDQSKDSPDTKVPERTASQPGNENESSTLEETIVGEVTGGATTGPEITSFEGAGSTNGQTSGEDACPIGPPEDAQPATVERAVDGDTLELKKPVEGYDRVRLIGVDTPELNKGEGDPEPHAEKATQFTAEALEGKEVLLETGKDIEDSYARLLAYVWLKSENWEPELFNEALLSEGHARLMTVEPNYAYAECFAGAEEKAREDNRGIWSDGGAEGNDEGREGLLGRIRDLLSSNDEPTGSENQYTEAETTALTQPTGELTADSSTMETPAETTGGTTKTTGAVAGLADVPPGNCPGATTVLEPFEGAENVQSPPFEITGGAFVVRADLQGEDPSAAHLNVSILDIEAQEPVDEFDQRTGGSYDTHMSLGPGSYLLDLKPQAGSYEVAVFDCPDEPVTPADAGSREPTVPEAKGTQDSGARFEMNSPALADPGPDETGGNDEVGLPAETPAEPVSDLPTRSTPSGEVSVLPDTGGPPPGLIVFGAVFVLVASVVGRRALSHGLAGRIRGNSGDPR